MPFYACIENLHDMPNLRKVTEVMTSYIWLSSPLETTHYAPLPFVQVFHCASVPLSYRLQGAHLQAKPWFSPLPCPSSDREQVNTMLLRDMPFSSLWRHFFWFEPTDALVFNGLFLTKFCIISSCCYKVVIQIISSARSSSKGARGSASGSSSL